MIYRIDVRTAAPAGGGDPASDPLGEAVRQQVREFGADLGPVRTSRIFLIDTPAARDQIERAARELLADPVVESASVFDPPPALDESSSRIEIHLKPGVMDPVAASTEMALRDMGLDVREVRTGRAYLIDGKVPREQLQRIASRVLANGVIESIYFDAFVPKEFERGREYKFVLRHVPLRDLSDEQLAKLSREGHLFLSLAEMQAIQAYYRRQEREPTDIELETLAQTWSEHCVHKTLKSAVDVEVRDASGKVIATRHYNNLIKDTIFASTQELMRKPGGAAESPVHSAEAHGRGARATDDDPFCLSVFSDNSGVIAFDESDAVCFKVETHNHPSAIEPYGGSATGVGGVVRDILGTGLAAKPIANTDVFCVAFPELAMDAETQRRGDAEKCADAPTDPPGSAVPASPRPRVSASSPERPRVSASDLPKGVIHPKRILQQVVAGVRDYGNRMGIPTVNGAVYFDDRYLGNPLVFCGCVGLIPRDKIHKEARPADAIVVMGGRTGRDGIHGATFSSAELTDTHADEFSHAVQIGNAITEKKMSDVILQARDRNLYTAITDCGAGGLSSAVGEMGEKLGALVELDKVPLKYAGLRYDEIWISEAQERMVLSVPQENLKELLELSASENVDSNVIGEFGTDDLALVLRYQGQQVGKLSMEFLHHGIPMPTRRAVIEVKDRGTRERQSASSGAADSTPAPPESVKERLLALLAHPNIASKHWIIRQYDHEVQGGSVIKPLTGPLQMGPSDAAVVRPKLGSWRGIALGCGLAPQIEDPFEMSLAAIDEAVRNVVAVGADPGRIAILDNFCWPSVDDERTMGSLVAACEACRDAALAYGIPFISGKDSLHNQFTNSETGQVIRIPNTLLISAIGVIEDVRRCVTMDLKKPGNHLHLIDFVPEGGASTPAKLAQVHRAIADAISEAIIASCHDVSDGGCLTAVAEMCIASGFGARVELPDPFSEQMGRYLVEVPKESYGELDRIMRLGFDTGEIDPDPSWADYTHIGEVLERPTLELTTKGRVTESFAVDELTSAWRGTLDW